MRSHAILAFLIASCLSALGQTNQLNATLGFTNQVGSAVPVMYVTVTPLCPQIVGVPYQPSTPLFFRKSSYPTLTNGFLTISNIQSGYSYAIQWNDGYSTMGSTNLFPAGLTGTVNATTYKGTYIGGTSYPGAQFAYLSTGTGVQIVTGTGGINVSNLGNGVFNIDGNAILGAATNQIAAITNGLATVAYVTAAINTATNGLSSGGGSTNGLATIAYVNASTNGLVTAAVTNGLATTAYAQAQADSAAAAATNVLAAPALAGIQPLATVNPAVLTTMGGNGGALTNISLPLPSILGAGDSILYTNPFAMWNIPQLLSSNYGLTIVTNGAWPGLDTSGVQGEMLTLYPFAPYTTGKRTFLIFDTGFKNLIQTMTSPSQSNTYLNIAFPAVSNMCLFAKSMGCDFGIIDCPYSPTNIATLLTPTESTRLMFNDGLTNWAAAFGSSFVVRSDAVIPPGSTTNSNGTLNTNVMYIDGIHPASFTNWAAAVYANMQAFVFKKAFPVMTGLSFRNPAVTYSGWMNTNDITDGQIIFGQGIFNVHQIYSLGSMIFSNLNGVQFGLAAALNGGGYIPGGLALGQSNTNNIPTGGIYSTGSIATAGTFTGNGSGLTNASGTALVNITNGLATTAYVNTATNTVYSIIYNNPNFLNNIYCGGFKIFDTNDNLYASNLFGNAISVNNLTATALTLTQPISISNVVATGLSPGQLLIVGPGGTIVSGSLSTNVSVIGKTVLFYATNVTGTQELVISNTASSNTFELFADGSIVENSAVAYVEDGMGSGNNSFAFGSSATATNNSFAFGTSLAGIDINSQTPDGHGYDVAIGKGAVAFGHNGGNAFAIGFNSLASGAFSCALGANASALTNGSVAIGSAVGLPTTASGINACALGDGTTANGDNSTAIGGNFVVTTAGNSIGIAPAGTHLNVIVTNSVSIAATNGVLISGGTNMVSITGGIASLSSNALAAATISFPLTTVKWTNSFGINIVLYINNSGVTGTAIAENGTTIFTIVSGDCTLYLKPGDYFAETYTVGSPTATWIPL